MIARYSLVSKISVKRYRTADGFSDSVFENLKVMFAALRFLRVYDLLAVAFYYDLRF
jgi:hypothetical protein